MRQLLLAASVLLVLVAACNGDDSSPGSTQSGVPPAACGPQPCTVGKICSLQAEPACDGTWYCWSDTNWHCAPPDSGGPGGPPDASGSSPDAPAEAAPVADASGG